MMLFMQFVAVALSATLAASAVPAAYPEEYVRSMEANDVSDQVIVPQKRAALVLDRLLVALQRALHEGGARYDVDRDGPRTAPLRISNMDTNDLSALQRRGQGSGRGRVLRCYFNAVTCF
ncbi:uncharacterized protein LOC106717888 [Papilio machaon]|uniref:uncharacterized protein LOC106717888 n=1 Tax=Papilio machaon TaxID=76193 RepID=UPI0006EB192D|nr:uncharacterized protein LOC106717888 [Papilio machaon]